MVGGETAPGEVRFAISRVRVAVVVVVALFIGLYWLNLVADLRKNEAEALDAARRRAVFTSQAAAEAVQTTLDRYRVTLTTAAIAAAQGPDALKLYGGAVSAGADEMVIQFGRIDADGFLTYSSLGPTPRNFLGDRDYFKLLAADPARPLVVNSPVLGRLTGKWTLQVAKAVTVNGRFDGVVALAVDPDQWNARLAKFEADNTDVLTLFSADGVYLLRTRDTSQSYGQRVSSNRPFLQPDSEPSGTYVETGRMDGIVRVYAWQRLVGGEVMVSGIGLDAATARTRDINRQTVLRGTAATIVVLLALGVIVHFSFRAERVSRAIAEKEDLQRVTLSVMAEGLAVVSPTGLVTFHNDGFARMVPSDPTDSLGVLGWDTCDASGRKLAPEEFPSIVTAVTGQPLDNFTLGLRLPDRSVRWLNVNTRPLLAKDGRPYASILTITDTTSQRAAERALKESEERYRTVVDSLAEGIVVQSADGTVLARNPAAERILGGAGSVSPFALHPNGAPFKDEDMPAMASLRTGERRSGVVMGLHKADGSITWVEVNTAPLWGGGQGSPVAVVSSFLDITHRKEFEDELSRSNAELEQFAYAVSHDLREPLRMVASYIQLLERRLGAAATDEMKEFVGFAVDGAKRMDRMLVALLEYSRVGRLGQPMDWTDSRRVLDEALMFLSPVIQQTGAQVAVDGQWPEILASADEIERLFQNLVGNALKYHAEGVAPAIQVSAGRDGAAWRFSFSDNGIGIAAEHIARLFKVFQRLHPASRYEGSGVGLALCRRIVQRHEGRIWVESDGPGTGSTFIFTLPATYVRMRVEAVAED
ncbi:MAG TPA: ATP-binding protein [Magnetospirillum sp.]|jgi:PAS domain S-box-containing protein|nr:ATP-binding protein [Magnetospirillum sp.]